MDLAGDGGGESAEEVAGDAARGLLVQLGEGELRRPVDGNEEVEPAFLRPDLGNIDVEVADRVALELGAPRLVTVRVRQSADAMALEAAGQT